MVLELQLHPPSKQMNVERYFSQDDSEEGFFSPLNETDWRSYLSAIDVEVGKFFKLFIESRHVSNHMDMIFSAMKWGKIIFTCDDGGDDDDVEVVTFHKSPVNIASRAIFFFMEKIIDVLVSEEKGISVRVCRNICRLIGIMRDEMLHGIASVDSCEYVLGVCHFKTVLAAVNEGVNFAKNLRESDSKMIPFANDLMIALFDVRELAWQSIVSCYAAERRCDDGPNFN
jgi:intracellular sulfur oxidation DsrE/DsrF family protein